jgi:hypothetical protein
VSHGNALFEWSQVLAAVGDASWRPLLDEAAALFRSAGCAEKDIRAALKNHTQVRCARGRQRAARCWWPRCRAVLQQQRARAHVLTCASRARRTHSPSLAV